MGGLRTKLSALSSDDLSIGKALSTPPAGKQWQTAVAAGTVQVQA